MPVPAQRLADTRDETSAERADAHRRFAPDDASGRAPRPIPAASGWADNRADLRDEPTRADRIMGRDHHETLASTSGTVGTGTSEDTQGLEASRTEDADSTNSTDSTTSTDSTDGEAGPDSGLGRSPGAHRA